MLAHCYLALRQNYGLTIADQAKTGPADSPGPGAGAGGGRRPQALRYIRDVLTRAGYALVVTGEPADVPRLMVEHQPHLALLDLALPDKDGIELVHEVHRVADVPVVILSEYGQGDTVARAFHMGTADYLVKPFSHTEQTASQT